MSVNWEATMRSARQYRQTTEVTLGDKLCLAGIAFAVIVWGYNVIQYLVRHGL